MEREWDGERRVLTLLTDSSIAGFSSMADMSPMSLSDGVLPPWATLFCMDDI